MQNGPIILDFVNSNHQLANIFTTPENFFAKIGLSLVLFGIYLEFEFRITRYDIS